MRALLLDIGNSRIKWGVYDGAELIETGDIPQAEITQRGLSVLTSRLPLDVDQVMASNVAGAGVASRLRAVLELHCGCEVRFARVTGQAVGITNGYKEPRSMGVDRWVAMIGAWGEVAGACVVVDAGTAVTVDVLDAGGQHLGGLILPGLAMMHETLAQATSDIPFVAPDAQVNAAGSDSLGTNTASAVGYGALHAIAGAVERAVRALRTQGFEPDIILTGGDASRILAAIDEPAMHRPNLVLAGLVRMLEHGS